MCFVPIVPMFHAFCKFFIYIIYIIFIYIFLLYYYIKLKNNWNIGTNKEKHVEKPVFPGFCMFHFYKFLWNMNWNILEQLEQILAAPATVSTVKCGNGSNIYREQNTFYSL